MRVNRKRDKLPIYLVGGGDICEGVDYLYSSCQGLRVSYTNKCCSRWEGGGITCLELSGRAAGGGPHLSDPLDVLFHIWSQLLILVTMWSWYDYPYFIGQATQAQGVKHLSKPMGQEGAEPEFKSGFQSWTKDLSPPCFLCLFYQLCLTQNPWLQATLSHGPIPIPSSTSLPFLSFYWFSPIVYCIGSFPLLLEASWRG